MNKFPYSKLCARAAAVQDMPIEFLLSEQDLDYFRQGFLAPCRWRAHTHKMFNDSIVINNVKNSFFCRFCDARGNGAVSFAKIALNMRFQDAIAFVENRVSDSGKPIAQLIEYSKKHKFPEKIDDETRMGLKRDINILLLFSKQIKRILNEGRSIHCVECNGRECCNIDVDRNALCCQLCKKCIDNIELVERFMQICIGVSDFKAAVSFLERKKNEIIRHNMVSTFNFYERMYGPKHFEKYTVNENKTIPLFGHN